MINVKLDNPNAGITKIMINPWNSEQIAISTWESNVEIYSTITGKLIQKFKFQAPQMDITYCTQAIIASVGADGHVNLNGQEIGRHNAPASCVSYLPSQGLIATGSLDGVLKLWRYTSSELYLTVELPMKIFCMTVLHSTIYCGCKEKDIFSINPLDGSYKHLPSYVKYHIRKLSSCEKTDSLIITTYSGRILVAYPEDNRDFISFHAHEKKEKNMLTLYPVNAAIVSPLTGQLFSGGSDGMVSVWNIETKSKIRVLDGQPAPTGIASLSFSTDGSKLAVAYSYGWEMGDIEHPPDRVLIVDQ